MRRGVAARQAERWKAQAGSRRFAPDARLGIRNWTGETTHSGERDIPRHPFPVVGWRQRACSGAPAGGRGNGVGPGILWIQRNPEAPPSSAGPTTCRCRVHPTTSRAPCRAEEATRCGCRLSPSPLPPEPIVSAALPTPLRLVVGMEESYK
jgi:hypothetical protein